MKKLTLGLMLLVTPAFAQQPVPFTDWRSSIDADLSKLSMPRDAHAAVFNILQAYERQAQMDKAREAAAKAQAEAPKQ